ncbi:hypothetical protein ACJIZ3_005725 [Penstemon smallii]|uniref:ARM repeat superfamily protein n=1 Tax=Penstemon smallii TaxID=265156 RepID=A0ABD3S5Y1_9LAMI
MELEEEQQSFGQSTLPISESLSGSGPMVSATVGRVMTTLLDAKPKKLADAISRLHTPPKIAPFTVSLEQSLWFLHKYIGEAEEKDEHLDQVLVPMIQHSLKMKKAKQGNQSMILLNWLFQDELLFQAIVRNLAGIISRRDDRYIALGWCIMGRSLIEYEDADNKLETSGIRKKYGMILKIFCSCVTHLTYIICKGSNMQEGFELPTRLAVAASDFILSLMVALSKKDLASDNITKKPKSVSINAKSQPGTLVQAATSDKQVNTLRQASELPSGLELKSLVWNNLDALIILVKKITAWSRKSRSLHAKGSDRILKWLQAMKQDYGVLQNEADSQMWKTGSLVLSSCWKHYGVLLHLEDYKFSLQYKELLDQYLSGIKFYADDQAEEPNMNKDSRSETINFFLNCLLLLLGRLNHQQFDNAVTEFGSRLSQVLMSQLRCADEEVIDGAISMFKAVIFRTNHILSKSSLGEIRQMDAVLPLLLNLLDERDAAAKAVVKLLAEYCSICSDSKCLHEVLKRIDSKNVAQRRNAVDVVANLVYVSSGSDNGLPQAIWQDVANHLLGCLGDEDQIIQNQAASLIPIIEPPLVLPALVGLSYSTHERVQLSASTSLLALLINHKQKPEILCMLLDTLSNLCQNPDSCTPAGVKEGKTLDARLLKLLSEWAKNVEDWNVIVGPLVDKMLAEPSNAVIVRFLSHISEYLAAAADLVFHRLILYMRELKEIDECIPGWRQDPDANSDSMKQEHCLFSRLSPLLIIRLLPLRVFDDINSPLVYGEFPRNSSANEDGQFCNEGIGCISAFLINRALSKSEFEDVRKLAAELCGRIHPKVLIPIVSTELETAAKAKDVLKIKVCLFSFCTSLMVRGSDAYRHPDVIRIRKTIQNILSWKSVDNDEISKAQHGCMDCLALMLCIELQTPELSKGSNLGNTSGDDIFRGSVLVYVINQLTDDEKIISFRICMANVLISACQKISGTGKKLFVKKILPRLFRSFEVMVDPVIRAACIQVLFSVAYHLKSFIFPYSNDLLNVALKSLGEGSSQKERMNGAKLLMSLMASEEEVIESISPGLLQARTLLQNLSSKDPSSDVRQMCQQLLLCMTSQ